MQLTKNFQAQELWSPDTKELPKPELIKKLQKLRDILGFPLIITSGMRSAEHNKKVGGSPNSRHLTGEAIDIACVDSEKRYKILTAAAQMNCWGGIGVADTFIHLDIRPVSVGRSWTYGG